jgi:acyl carrier protein
MTAPSTPSATPTEVIRLLAETLALSPASAAALTPGSALFGELPELDSMAVATVLTGIEDRFGVLIDDDEVDGDLFASVQSLADFVAAKQARAPA